MLNQKTQDELTRHMQNAKNYLTTVLGYDEVEVHEIRFSALTPSEPNFLITAKDTAQQEASYTMQVQQFSWDELTQYQIMKLKPRKTRDIEFICRPMAHLKEASAHMTGLYTQALLDEIIAPLERAQTMLADLRKDNT